MQGREVKEGEVRIALQRATSAVHERLHDAEPFAAIFNERLGLAGYAGLLRRVAAFHLTVAPAIPRDEDRRRHLLDDLAALGCAPPEAIAWSAPSTESAKLGCAYVVEGSRLGGKLIYRQLDYLFGERQSGRRFFRGSLSDGQRWRALCAHLEVEGRRPGALVEMVAGARATFALFDQLVVASPAYA